MNLTTRELFLLDDDKLSEVTIRKGDPCGSSLVHKASLVKNVRKSAQMKENHHDQLQYIIQDFC